MDLTTDTQKQTARSEKGSRMQTISLWAVITMLVATWLPISQKNILLSYLMIQRPLKNAADGREEEINGWLEGMADQTRKFVAGQSGEEIRKVRVVLSPR